MVGEFLLIPLRKRSSVDASSSVLDSCVDDAEASFNR